MQFGRSNQTHSSTTLQKPQYKQDNDEASKCVFCNKDNKRRGKVKLSKIKGKVHPRTGHDSP